MRVAKKFLGLLVLSLLLPIEASAQELPVIPTQDIPITQDPAINQPTITPAQTGGIGSTFGLEGFNIDTFEIDTGDFEFENMRLQPFVGRSLARYQEQGLVHPRSLIEGTSAGSNLGGGGGRTTQFGGGRGGQAGGQGQFGFGGTSASNQVIRSNLRTRLVPQIVVTNRLPPIQQAAQIQRRFDRIPTVANLASNFNMTINGTTATLTGSVGSEADRQRIERMIQLEPGIYRIDNQITISN